MTDNTAVLGADPTPVEKDTNPSVEDQVKSALASLVGDDKRFKDEEALAKSKLESDAYIKHLQDEGKEARELISELQEKLRQATTQREMDELRKELSAKPTPAKEEVTTSQPSKEDLESLVREQITARETETTAKANLNKTNEALVSHYGDPDKAKAAVAKRASALGVSVEDITNMAMKSPTAALSLLKGETVEQSPSIDKSGGVQTIATPAQEMSTKAEFDKLRRENWHKYFSPEVQNRIFQLKQEGKYN